MEDQLNFIQNQLWALLTLMFLFVLSNVYCYITKNDEKKKKDDLERMWEQGNINDLINQSEKILQENPYNFDALFYGAKAMASQNNYEDAIKQYKKIIEIEPGFRSSMQSQIDELTEILNEGSIENASLESTDK